MKKTTKIGIVTLVIVLLITATVSALLSINQLTQQTGIFFAPNYASSGTGTESSPYVNCLYNCYNLMTNTSKGEIYFPKGYYLETHQLVFDHVANKPQHVAITGAGFWDSVISCSYDIGGPLITVINSASLYMQGVQIHGNTGMSVTCPLIYLRDSYDVTIQNSFICRGKGDGIQLGSADGVYHPWAIDILNCPVEYFGGIGINIYGSHNTNLESLTIAFNTGYGINVGGVNSNADATITDSCIVASYKDAIHIGKYCSAIITDNEFECHDITQNYSGILIDCISNTLRPIIISHNTFNNYYGLYFKTAYRNNQMTIEGNDFTQCTKACNFPILIHKGIVTDNLGLNPIGKYTKPFINAFDSNYIEPNNGKAAPSNGITYTVQVAPCRIISTGGTGVNINTYDGKGNLMKNYGSTCDVTLAIGQTINFGAFSSSPTVSVFFE